MAESCRKTALHRLAAIYSSAILAMTDLPPEIQVAIDTPFHNVLPPEPGSLGPNSVGGLYIGSLSAVVGGSVNALRSLNISIIIQVLHIPFLVLSEEEGFTCYRVDIDDRPSQNLDAQLLEQVCVYIEEMRNSGKGVLVHCQQGISRSASIVIAYLIRNHRMTYDQALELVKSKRACVEPNAGFVRCLRAWEEKCSSIAAQ